MTSSPLDDLARVLQAKRSRADEAIQLELLWRLDVQLADAQTPSLSLESRFDLAYNAAHALALAALRFRGYRSDNRYLVFQTLPHTRGLPHEMWRVLDRAHRKRNLAEYEATPTSIRLSSTRSSAQRASSRRVRALGPWRRERPYAIVGRRAGYGARERTRPRARFDGSSS